MKKYRLKRDIIDFPIYKYHKGDVVELSFSGPYPRIVHPKGQIMFLEETFEEIQEKPKGEEYNNGWQFTLKDFSKHDLLIYSDLVY